MSTKAFKVYVELDIQAVTCPGVWLCPNGKVILKISMFGNAMKTSHLPPVFPLLYHQTFTFEKVFSYVRSLTELQKLFDKEFLQADLLQCSSGTDVLLATFKTTLSELLYPSPCMKGLIAGVDVDLLMHPTTSFPGIIAPKVEVSTRTTIEEIIDSVSSFRRNPGLINPKMLSSKSSPSTKKRHQSCKQLRRRRILPFSKKVDGSYKDSAEKGADDDDNICTCHHCSQKKTDNLLCSWSAKTLNDCSTARHSSQTSRKICRPQSNSVAMDPVLQEEKFVKRIRRDSCCKECQNAEGNQSCHICNCSICKAYRSYFGDNCDKYAEKLDKQASSNLNQCFCSEEFPTQDKVRLAEAVHQHVSSILDPASCYPFVGDDKHVYEQSRSDVCPHRADFYRSLEKFYKQLYKRVKHRTSQKTIINYKN